MLSKVFIVEKSHVKPFLVPHGNLKSDNLKLDVENVKEVLVYETVVSQSLEKDFMDVTNDLSVLPEFLVFFSPSGVKASSVVLKKIEDLLLIKVNMYLCNLIFKVL